MDDFDPLDETDAGRPMIAERSVAMDAVSINDGDISANVPPLRRLSLAPAAIFGAVHGFRTSFFRTTFKTDAPYALAIGSNPTAFPDIIVSVTAVFPSVCLASGDFKIAARGMPS